MRLKTFCYPKELLRRNFSRFSPLWVLYLLMQILLLVLLRANEGYYFATGYADFVDFVASFSLGYAFFVTQALFGDLFNTRLCNGLHSLPVRREQLYAVNVVTGLVFNLIPTTLAALMAMPMLAGTPVTDAVYLPLYWWVSANLSYLFFFALGVCCVMLSGNRLGQAALYGVVNFGTILAYGLVDTVYTPLLFGVITPSDPYVRFSPLAQLVSGQLINVTSHQKLIGPDQYMTTGTYVLGNNWGYLAVLTVLGLLLLGAGVWLYRRRSLECAGDFLAAPKLSGAVLVMLALSAGTVAAYLGNSMGGTEWINALCLACGVAVGWFAGKMFLERSTQVFRLKNWRGLCVLGLAMLVSLGLTKADVLGIRTRVPELEDIASIRMDYNKSVAQEDFDQVRSFHTQALETVLTRDMFGDNGYVYDSIRYYDTFTLEETQYQTTRITYVLKNGSTVDRRYCVAQDTPQAESLRKLQSTIPYVFSRSYDQLNDDRIPQTKEDVMALALEREPASIEIGYVSLPTEQVNKQTVKHLLEAFLLDVEEGNAAPNQFFHDPIVLSDGVKMHSSYDLYIRPTRDDSINGYDWSILLDVYPDCAHTMALLEELGITAEKLNARWENRPLG